MFDVEPFDEDQGTGDLRYVQVINNEITFEYIWLLCDPICCVVVIMIFFVKMAVTTNSTSLRAPERYKNGWTVFFCLVSLHCDMMQ